MHLRQQHIEYCKEEGASRVAVLVLWAVRYMQIDGYDTESPCPLKHHLVSLCDSAVVLSTSQTITVLAKLAA